MNFKVRLKNKAFWLGFVPTAISFIYSTLALLGIVPGISEAVLIKLATMIISALGLLGVFVDPTTEGLGDSERAMAYAVPYAKPEKKRFSILSLFKKNKDGDK